MDGIKEVPPMSSRGTEVSSTHGGIAPSTPSIESGGSDIGMTVLGKESTITSECEMK